MAGKLSAPLRFADVLVAVVKNFFDFFENFSRQNWNSALNWAHGM